MKKYLIFLFLLFTSILFAIESLNNEFLINSEWGNDKSDFGFRLKFNKNNTYYIFFAGEGGGQDIIGDYNISNNKITLNPTEINEYGELPEKLKIKTTWTLKEDLNSLFYNYKIVSNNNYSFWRYKSKAKAGVEREINGISIVLTEKKYCDLLYNSKVRELPDIKSKYYTYQFHDEEKIYHYMPKEYGLIIIGRTLYKTKINDWNNYWYYCKLPVGWYDVGKKYGWVYGALIDK